MPHSGTLDWDAIRKGYKRQANAYRIVTMVPKHRAPRPILQGFSALCHPQPDLLVDGIQLLL
jgi:hypothetical protein